MQVDLIEPIHPGRFWMNLQAHYELRIERRAPRDKIAEITPLSVA